jgi:hypothetical protein
MPELFIGAMWILAGFFVAVAVVGSVMVLYDFYEHRFTPWVKRSAAPRKDG